MTHPHPLKDAMANRPKRPHESVPTPLLRGALARTSQDAKRYAQTGPKVHENICHLLADEYLDELRTRGEL
ncbi:hypothetical protein ACIQPQ_31040 [Streptomyces sp. NPDC091281]|uniref:hypothetical protein n=1 Tax=Streptomyces sp. NPDC091281 TaxID=3365985 RepID=UPI00380A0FBC